MASSRIGQIVHAQKRAKGGYVVHALIEVDNFEEEATGQFTDAEFAELPKAVRGASYRFDQVYADASGICFSGYSRVDGEAVTTDG